MEAYSRFSTGCGLIVSCPLIPPTIARQFFLKVSGYQCRLRLFVVKKNVHDSYRTLQKFVHKIQLRYRYFYICALEVRMVLIIRLILRNSYVIVNMTRGVNYQPEHPTYYPLSLSHKYITITLSQTIISRS